MKIFRILYLDYQRQETLPVLEMVWARLAGDRLADTIFYDGSVNNFAEFANELLRPGCLPFAVFCGEDLAAFTWLNCITGRMARTHFMIFRRYWGRKQYVNLGRHIYAYILTRKDNLGYLFDCLVGITPENNRLAFRAALDCGWAHVGTLPKSCFLAARNESVAGLLTCATREFLDISETAEAVWAE